MIQRIGDVCYAPVMVVAARRALAISICVAACSTTDPPSSIPDAGPSADARPALAIEAPAPPEAPAAPDTEALESFAPDPPARPILTPCPEGWIATADPRLEHLEHCEPWTTTATCALDEAQFPGTENCEKIGTPCPNGQWPEGLPGGPAILYVDPAAPAGGDGSQSLPFSTIARAMNAARSGTIIALSKGTFDEAISLRTGAILWGSCPAETILNQTASAVEPTVRLTGLGTEIRNLQIRGRSWGVFAQRNVGVTLHGVLIHQTRGFGIIVGPRSFAGGDRVVIRDVDSAEGTRIFGRGISVENGGTGDFDQLVVERTELNAVASINAGSVVRLERFVLRDTREQDADRIGGQGALSIQGSHAELRAGVIERSRAYGAAAYAATMLIEDVLITETETSAYDNLGGAGIVAAQGGTLTARRVFLASNTRDGAVAGELGSRLELEDAIIADTRPRGISGSETGAGLSATDGAVLTATRAISARNGTHAAFAGAGTIELTDVELRDTASAEPSTYGRGLAVQENSRARLTRVALQNNRELALGVLRDSSLIGRDISIRETLPEEVEPCSGDGMTLQEASTADLARVLIEGSSGRGLVARNQGTRATIEDLIVRDTRPIDCEASFGQGLALQDGAELNISRAILERNTFTGLIATEELSSARLSDVVIRDTLGRAAGGSGPAPGVLIALGAQVHISRARIERNRLAGMLIISATTSVELEDISVVDTIPEPSLGGGRGIDVEDRATVLLARGELRGNSEIAVFLQLQAELSATDLSIRDTGPRPSDQSLGVGIAAQSGAQLELQRVLLRGNREGAIHLDGEGTSLTAADLSIFDTGANSADGTGGRGLVAQRFARARLQRAVLSGNREFGIVVIEDAGLEAEHVRIEDTRARACARTTCPEFEAGIGVASADRGRLRMEFFSVARSSLAGLQVAGGELDLRHGLVTENPIGVAIIGDASYDAARLTTDVEYGENGLDVDFGASFPAPDLSRQVGGLEP